jgi:hypothetical protein
MLSDTGGNGESPVANRGARIYVTSFRFWRIHAYGDVHSHYCPFRVCSNDFFERHYEAQLLQELQVGVLGHEPFHAMDIKVDLNAVLVSPAIGLHD